jgi:S-adenosylmethionine-diacylgycerolhomoserine-N-methlytransferase
MRDQAQRMDAMYGFQRHFYDLTRKPYLLGRDMVIASLDVPANGTVLEIGCGTGRNLVHIARAYPAARCFGLDVSAKMLETAAGKIARETMADRVTVAAGDATCFDPQALFGIGKFDRVVISYALSMIPAWKDVLSAGADLLSPTGSLYVVDFSDQSGLPVWFRRALRAWLARFSVTPREELADHIAGIAWLHGYDHKFRRIYKGYAAVAELSAR